MEASVERKLSWTEKLINWRNQYVSDKQFKALDKAVEDENYELASHLLDEMRRRKLL